MSEEDGVVNDSPLLELYVSCSNLVSLDLLSKSDPLVVCYVKPPGEDWVEHGRTEMIKDSLNPRFVKSFKLEYHFEQLQYLRFSCYDIDDLNAPLEKQDFIGEAEYTLAEVVSAQGRAVTRELKLPAHPNKGLRGYIAVMGEEVQESNSVAFLELSGSNLDKKDLFGKSDPFFVISRSTDQGGYVPVAKSEVVHKSLNPEWNCQELSLQQLCNGDLSRPIKVDVFDYNRSGKHELIGYFVTTVEDLSRGAGNNFTLMNPAVKAKKKSYRGSGTISFENFRLEKRFDFLDYVRGGLNINLVTGIDFTASNGNPMLRKSLHYIGGAKPNEYLQALEAVVDVLGTYDSDQRFPVFGFGAKVPSSSRRGGGVAKDVSHCFALNDNENAPEVAGLLGIREVYQKKLQEVTLYGPTIFADVLQRAVDMTPPCRQHDQNYTICLILTDGVMDDLEAVVNLLVQENDTPISIVIIGIGDADFSRMEFLDADDAPLKSTWGQEAARDLVQFVPFNQYKNKPSHELAKVIFEEIPGQMLSYFQAHNIVPNEPNAELEQRPPPPSFAPAVSANYTGIGGNQMYHHQFVRANAWDPHAHQAHPTWNGEGREDQNNYNHAQPYQDMRTSWFMGAPPPPAQPAPGPIYNQQGYVQAAPLTYSAQFENDAMRISQATRFDVRYA